MNIFVPTKVGKKSLGTFFFLSQWFMMYIALYISTVHPLIIALVQRPPTFFVQRTGQPLSVVTANR